MMSYGLESNYSLSKEHSDSFAVLRDLLDANQQNPKRSGSSVDYLAAKYHFNPAQVPALDDLINLLQTSESMNQQLINENRLLKDEIANCKANVIKLIQENSKLHSELKNVTIHEILNELHDNKSSLLNEKDRDVDSDLELKEKTEELHQCQLLINDLQNRLKIALNSKNLEDKINKVNNQNEIDEDELLERDGTVCSKCGGVNDLEIKVQENNRLKRENEQLNKSVNYFKLKYEESKTKETDSYMEVKKYVDLVKHLELEKEQAFFEREQIKVEKENLKTRTEELINELDKKILKEKESVENEFREKIKKLIDQCEATEEKLTKTEAVIDRLTREKVTIASELEDYKNKYNTIDFDSHQMTEKLKNQYREVLKERDLLLHEMKRVRHDYDLYVQQNDQDKFCLRNELNTTRNRLTDVEREFSKSQEKCIELTEETNRLQTEILSLKHAKETVENSRNEALKKSTDQFKKREAELSNALLQLQAKHCVKVKELEDLIDAQKSLLNKLREECKTLTQHLETSEIRNSENQNMMMLQIEEYKLKSNKYDERLRESEEQNTKHTELLERMKDRLKELTLKTQDQHEKLQKLTTNEHKLKLTNQQLCQDLATVRQQLAIFNMPSKMQTLNKAFDYNIFGDDTQSKKSSSSSSGYVLNKT